MYLWILILKRKANNKYKNKHKHTLIDSAVLFLLNSFQKKLSCLRKDNLIMFLKQQAKI